MPDFMFSHVSAGYGGQGTLCGALGVASQYFRMVAYDKAETHIKMIDELFQWYSRTDFPTQRFDDICHFPNQVRRNAKTPLCHISVSQWTLAAGATVTSKEKKRSLRQGDRRSDLSDGVDAQPVCRGPIPAPALPV